MSRFSTQLTGADAQTAGLTESERYRVLSDKRRRLTLDILDERADGVTLVELAETVADRTDLSTSRTATRELQISLHHKHLPMLDDYGLVDYDHDTRWVRPA